MVSIPDTILTRIDDLNALVTKHPYNIPLKDLSSFLHMDVNCFRFAAMQGGTPFDIHWSNGSNEVRVPTLAFYMFFMGSILGGNFLLMRSHKDITVQPQEEA